MRASDSERERIVRELTQHCGDGRLTLDELEDRIAEAYAATTSDELRHAIRELPATPHRIIVPPTTRADAPTVVPAVRASGAVTHRRHGAAEVALRIHLVSYLSVIGFLVAIWFLTSPFGYFWPVWPAMSWGLALVLHAGVQKVKSDL